MTRLLLDADTSWPPIFEEEARPPDRHGILQLLGRDLRALSKATFEAKLQQAFQYWRSRGFPYPVLSNGQIVKQLGRLIRVSAADLDVVLARPSMVGLRLANAFHPRMWSARVRGKSPLECFNDDQLLRKGLRKIIRFWPHRRCWNAYAIRNLASIENRSRVANFRPTVARAVIAAFSGDTDRLLDFSAGYGGRLLGALSLERHYTGIDPAIGQCRGLTHMVTELSRWFEQSSEIINGCAEDVMPNLSSNSYDLVFSSPPYYNLEKYNSEPTQSYLRYRTYESWKESFLFSVIEQCERVVKPGGCLVINVSNTQRYTIADDACAFASGVFGEPEVILHMTMSTNPADKARRNKLSHVESIFVFRKVR